MRESGQRIHIGSNEKVGYFGPIRPKRGAVGPHVARYRRPSQALNVPANQGDKAVINSTTGQMFPSLNV